MYHLWSVMDCYTWRNYIKLLHFFPDDSMSFPPHHEETGRSFGLSRCPQYLVTECSSEFADIISRNLPITGSDYRKSPLLQHLPVRFCTDGIRKCKLDGRKIILFPISNNTATKLRLRKWNGQHRQLVTNLLIYAQISITNVIHYYSPNIIGTHFSTQSSHCVIRMTTFIADPHHDKNTDTIFEW